MQRPKRWIAGKRPDWVQDEDNEAAAPPAASAAAAAAAPPRSLASPGGALLAGADPRLLRLAQRQGGAVGERRAAGEAVVVQRRRREPSPDEEEEAAEASPPPPRRRQQASPPARAANGPGSEGREEEEEREDDEESIAARRLAIRARQLAAAQAAVAGGSEDEDGASEESSEYETDDSDDEGPGAIMLKPAFVPKTERETLAEREAALAAAEATTRQDAEVLEGRKRQTQEIVIQAALQEGQQDAPEVDGSDFDTGDEADEAGQYEAWRERELLRIARDRHLRQAGTKAEADAAAAAGLPAAPAERPVKKWKFLQKYWHKGAFFQGDDQAEVLGDVLKRSYDAPTGEDRFNKEALPKIMQVRNFGRRGRTKWTHLMAEDTTMQDAPAAGPGAEAGAGMGMGMAPSFQLPPRQPATQQQQDFSKPRKLKT